MSLLLFIMVSLPVLAQTGGTWSKPINISRSPDQMSHGPRILADRFGGIHIFWMENVDHGRTGNTGLDTIYYSRQTRDGFSEPIDILVSPSGGTILLGGVVNGPQGELAIVWTDPDHVFFSWAWPTEADNPHAWTTEIIHTGRATWPDLFIDHLGHKHVVWEDTQGTIWYIRYSMGTAELSQESLVWGATDKRRGLFPRVLSSSSGAIHVVWSEISAEYDWESSGVWYARSTDGGATWSDFLYEADQGWWINVGLDAEGELHLIWEHGVGSSEGRWHRYSVDEGLHWSEPQVMFTPGPASGKTRWPVLGTDSSGTLHYVTPFNSIFLNGQTYFSECVLHSEWSGRSWINTEIIACNIGEFADLAISHGNRLHVVTHGGPTSHREILYTTRTTDAPELTPERFVEPEVETYATVPVSPTVVNESSPSSVVSPNRVRLETARPAHSTHLTVLAVSVGTAGLLVLLVIAAKVRVRR